jgi:hypothetical protein
MIKKLVIPTMVGMLALGVSTYAGMEGALFLPDDVAGAPVAQSPLETPTSPGGPGKESSDLPSGDPASKAPGGREERPDLATVAEALGVTEEALQAALGDPSDGRPDLAAAATELGISQEELQQALGVPGSQPPGSGEGPGGKGPDMAAAAQGLGVTEEALRAALGDPSSGPPDLAAAAQALGVTEDDLKEALGPPPSGSHGEGNQPPGGTSTGEGPSGIRGSELPGGGEQPPSGDGPPSGPPPGQ